MMFKEEYKKAYDEIQVADGKVNEILKQAKCRNLPKQRNTMWKNVVATMLLAIMLIVGINIPAFAQEIERVTRILNTGAIDYTYYKSLQRENLEWTQNAFVPNNASIKKDGIIMKVELVTFYRKKYIILILQTDLPNKFQNPKPCVLRYMGSLKVKVGKNPLTYQMLLRMQIQEALHSIIPM